MQDETNHLFTTLQFPEPLPDKHILLEQVKTNFPGAKSKLSIASFIDIRYQNVITSLDLSKQKITVHSHFDRMVPANIIRRALPIIAILGGYWLIQDFREGAPDYWFPIILLVFAVGVYMLLPKSEVPDVVGFRDTVVAFLKTHFKGAVVEKR